MSDAEAEEATREVWRRGSYEVVGDWFADASRAVLHDSSGPLALEGRSLLDVACGTGAVAIPAARAGARVTGLDITPEMLEVARVRAATAGVEVELVERSFANLGGLGRFDLVTSAFGVMFSPDPTSTARELASVLADKGVVSLAAWHPDGGFGSMPAALIDLLPSGGIDPTRWSEPDAVAAFFGDTRLEVRDSTRDSVAVPFASAEAAVGAFREHAGPWMSLFEHLEGMGLAEQANRILVGHIAERSDPTPDGIALRADFVVTHVAAP